MILTLNEWKYSFCCLCHVVKQLVHTMVITKMNCVLPSAQCWGHKTFMSRHHVDTSFLNKYFYMYMYMMCSEFFGSNVSNKVTRSQRKWKVKKKHLLAFTDAVMCLCLCLHPTNYCNMKLHIHLGYKQKKRTTHFHRFNDLRNFGKLYPEIKYHFQPWIKLKAQVKWCTFSMFMYMYMGHNFNHDWSSRWNSKHTDGLRRILWSGNSNQIQSSLKSRTKLVLTTVTLDSQPLAPQPGPSAACQLTR